MVPSRPPPIPQFLEESDTLRSLGELGPKASRAVPLLDRIAPTTRTNHARLDDFDPRQADSMRLAAISSLFQINPNRAAPHLPFVLEHYANWEAIEAIDLLRRWRAMREQIIPPILEQLEEPKKDPNRRLQAFTLNSNRRLRAAFILHGVAPELEEPRRILETALTSNDLKTRAAAVNWLSLLRLDVPQPLPVAREILKASDDRNTLHSVLNVLEKLGDAARPAIPELKSLLASKLSDVRDRAGHLLRQLSPADMPPIIE